MSRVLLIVVLVLGIAGSVAAAGPNDNWIVYLKAADSSGNNGLATSCLYGTKAGATDFPAESTNDTSNLASSGTQAVLGCFDLGSGAYNNGYYKDLRAPYDAATHPLPTWNLRLWVQPNWNSGDLVLSGWNQAGSYGLNGSIHVALKVISDPTGTYKPGSIIWQFGNTHGTSATPEFSAIFHNLTSIKGGGYVNLQLTDCTQPAAVPEPGSLMSLAGILSGFSGLALLRRRRS